MRFATESRLNHQSKPFFTDDYMMSGDSRQVWQHSIPPVEAARYSITFRTLREG